MKGPQCLRPDPNNPGTRPRNPRASRWSRKEWLRTPAPLLKAQPKVNKENHGTPTLNEEQLWTPPTISAPAYYLNTFFHTIWNLQYPTPTPALTPDPWYSRLEQQTNKMCLGPLPLPAPPPKPTQPTNPPPSDPRVDSGTANFFPDERTTDPQKEQPMEWAPKHLR
ncbi:hypothetical protein E4T56_gene10505 [Termitomyces sp. T112]|nr:hypothetical protein E4T56_gene10505 [Termitomyces sp. T112]